MEFQEELSKLKRNIINWYPFKENASILEIWEGQENTNLEEQKYDYVVTIGLGEKNVKDIVKLANSRLKENGVFLIAVDNKLGITNFCTAKEKKQNDVSRKTLEAVLDANGFVNRKYYFPMPNYKATNVIFTDKCLPNFETINRSLTLYDESVKIALEENKCFNIIIDENKQLFRKFSNSYFIECSKNELEDNDITFVSYSNIRKPEYRIKTVIQGDNVYKTNNTEESISHINTIKKNIDILKLCNINTTDTYDEHQIISKYQNTDFLLDNIILKKLKNGQEQEAIDLIYKFKDELLQKLEKTNTADNNCFDKYNIEYENDVIKDMHFVKHGLWDLIFQNCFYIDNKFYFYDQEWYEENVPIEFIMYRTIKYFDKISTYISKEEIYEKLNIKAEQMNLFDILDDKLQENIRDEKIWDILRDKDYRNLAIKLNKLEQENNHLNAVVTQYSDRIKDFEKSFEEARQNLILQDNRIKEQDKIIEEMVNSKSWKITKPLRKITESLKSK